MKRSTLFAGLLTLGLLFSAAPAFADNATPMDEWNNMSNLTIHIDGTYLPCDVSPVIVDSRTLMPLRAAAEALGATVDWSQSERAALLSKDGRYVTFYIDSNTYYINGVTHTTDVPAQIVDSRTLIPLRAFAEALDTKVSWNQDIYDVAIDTEAEDFVVPALPPNAPVAVQKWIKKYYVAEDGLEPFIGSWHKEISAPTGNANGDVVVTQVYFFISRIGENFQFVTLAAEDIPGYDDTIITIEKHDAWSTGDTTYRRYDTPNIAYYYGPARGFTYEGYSDFECYRGALIYTGYLDTFGLGEEYYYDINEPSYRFNF